MQVDDRKFEYESDNTFRYNNEDKGLPQCHLLGIDFDQFLNKCQFCGKEKIKRHELFTKTTLKHNDITIHKFVTCGDCDISTQFIFFMHLDELEECFSITFNECDLDMVELEDA